jgi:hypothetical protein
MEKVRTAERQPVATVPKSTSVGEMTMQAGFCCGTHTPAEHVWPGPHAAHTLPLCPHAIAEVAVDATHVLPLQQPVQFVGLHVAPPVQAPAVQLWLGPQATQVAPFTPHDIGDCIDVGWQTPFEQQPAQLKKSQAATGVHAPMVHELFTGHV